MIHLSIQRWHEISKDPNDPIVIKTRREGLQAARTGGG